MYQFKFQVDRITFIIIARDAEEAYDKAALTVPGYNFDDKARILFSVKEVLVETQTQSQFE